MNIILSILVVSLGFSAPPTNDSSTVDELKIARTLRQAVRDADSTLLKATLLGNWRDYLKASTTDLNTELQPLVLIKFDEDMAFRTQLKTIIEWQYNWQHKETEHFVYYYRWDQPPPEVILEIQEIQFNELARLFKIEAPEKIPYRYDLTAKETTVYPYEDLRGGLVSPQPFDLEKSALAIFGFINSEPPAILEPLCRIYGSYFQNPSTSLAYFEHCLTQIKKHGYISATELYQINDPSSFSAKDWFSIYAFVYMLDREFGPEKIARFLATVNCSISADKFQAAFAAAFAVNLAEFESRFQQEAVLKM
ncbi:MAG: hypothetical protein ACE5G1_14245 [bacterium]